jgi:hypothetical protein
LGDEADEEKSCLVKERISAVVDASLIMDLKYDYEEALKRQNFNQSQVNALRDAAEKCDQLPKMLTDKQVNIYSKKFQHQIDEF